MWYCVHARHYFHETEAAQTKFVFYESLYLIEAATRDEARSKAEAKARLDEGGEGFTVNGRRAQLKFGCIFKFVDCHELGDDGRPADGSDLSYSVYVADSEEEFKNFLAGEPARVIYDD